MSIRDVQRLIRVVHQDDDEGVFALITKGVDVNEAECVPEDSSQFFDDRRRPPLCSVNCTEKGLEICGLLIAARANVNYSDDKTQTLLHAMAAHQQPDIALRIARLLIAAGAHVNNDDGDTGNSPLINAIDEGNLPFAKLLLKCKADVNYAISDPNMDLGFTAIFCVHSAEAVALLMRYGANIEALGTEEESLVTPLIHIFERWHNVGPNDTDVEFHPELVKALINHGANVRAQRTGDGANGLHCMAIGAHIPWGGAEIAEMLLGGGLDVNQVNSRGYTVRTVFLVMPCATCAVLCLYLCVPTYKRGFMFVLLGGAGIQ